MYESTDNDVTINSCDLHKLNEDKQTTTNLISLLFGTQTNEWQ